MDNEPTDQVNEMSAVAQLMFPESNPSPDDGPDESSPADEPPQTEDDGAQHAEAQEPEPADVPGDVKTLAEQLGVETKDLYEKLEVPLGDGKRLTLGEIKHRAQDLLKADTLKAELEDQRARFTAERLQFESEMGALEMALQSGQPLSPEIVEQARTAAEQRLEIRNRSIMKAAPHLSSEGAQAKVAERAKAYGIPATVLAQFPLPGLILAFDRLNELETRIEAAQTAKSEPKKAMRPTGKAPSSKAQGLSKLKSDVQSGKLNAVDAVAKLLG